MLISSGPLFDLQAYDFGYDKITVLSTALTRVQKKEGDQWDNALKEHASMREYKWW